MLAYMFASAIVERQSISCPTHYQCLRAKNARSPRAQRTYVEHRGRGAASNRQEGPQAGVFSQTPVAPFMLNILPNHGGWPNVHH